MMDQDRKSVISLESFDICISEIFRNLISDTEFTDVTLVCDDDKQIDAHKVVLSNTSAFFKRILIRNPHQKPMIYLKGFNYEEVKSIIEFIYLGRTEVYQDNINRFIDIAIDLEIKGIDKNLLGNETDESPVVVTAENSHAQNLDDVFQEDRFKTLKKTEDEIEEPLEESDLKTELADAKIDGNSHTSLNGNDIADKESFKQINSPCKEAGQYQCTMCDKSYSHKNVLKRHNKTVHYGLRFPCHICDHKATQQQSLKRHLKNIHGC